MVWNHDLDKGKFCIFSLMFLLWLWNLDIGTINSWLYDCVFPKNGFLLGNINHLVTCIISVSEPSCRMNATFICYLEPKVFDHFHIRILIPVINVRLPCKRMVQHPGFSKKKWKLMYLQRFWIMLEHCILDWEIWMKQRLVEICFFYWIGYCIVSIHFWLFQQIQTKQDGCK